MENLIICLFSTTNHPFEFEAFPKKLRWKQLRDFHVLPKTKFQTIHPMKILQVIFPTFPTTKFLAQNLQCKWNSIEKSHSRRPKLEEKKSWDGWEKIKLYRATHLWWVFLKIIQECRLWYFEQVKSPWENVDFPPWNSWESPVYIMKKSHAGIQGGIFTNHLAIVASLINSQLN